MIPLRPLGSRLVKKAVFCVHELINVFEDNNDVAATTVGGVAAQGIESVVRDGLLFSMKYLKKIRF